MIGFDDKTEATLLQGQVETTLESGPDIRFVDIPDRVAFRASSREQAEINRGLYDRRIVAFDHSTEPPMAMVIDYDGSLLRIDEAADEVLTILEAGEPLANVDVTKRRRRIRRAWDAAKKVAKEAADRIG